MNKYKNERGFDIIVFQDIYGSKCSLQKSSIATDDCIWFGVNDPEPLILASSASRFGVKTDETTGWVEYPIPDDVSINTRMHLSRDQVSDILPYLIKFSETGEI